MIKLNLDAIVMRVVEHGWESPEELDYITDLIIQEDATEMFTTQKGRLSDMEELFEYTASFAKQVKQKAIEVQNKQNKENE